MSSTGADLLETHQLDSGAIVSWTADQPGFTGKYAVNPYFANFAALGLLECGRLPAVRRWIAWYVGHLNRPDVHGLTGTVYDYRIDPVTGEEEPTLDYDSVDSYASTFLNLVHAYWKRGTSSVEHAAEVRGEVRGLRAVLLELVGVIDAVTDHDGLTWAKPGWMVKYLMDNAEVYAGLADAVALWRAAWPDDTATLRGLVERRERTRCAILDRLGGGDEFAMQLDESGTPELCSGRAWYPHATAGVYPALWGVVEPTDPRAVRAWATLNGNFPRWPELDTGDSFPWAIIGYAAVVMGDQARAGRFLRALHGDVLEHGRPVSGWYCAEAGWALRIDRALSGSGQPA